MARSTFRWLSILFTIALAISLCLGQVATVKAQAANGDLLVQRGVESYQQGKYEAAIALWDRALSDYQRAENNPNTVIVLENLARVHQQIGRSEQAISYWLQVTDRYRQVGDEQQLGRSLSELAQAYISLGQHRQAIAILCGDNDDPQQQCSPTSAIALASKNADALGEVAAKGSLGEAYRLRGNYTQAVNYLKDSLSTAKTLDRPQLEISTLNGLGSTYSNLAKISYRQAESAETRGEIYGSDGSEYAADSPVMQLRADGKQQDRLALNYFQDSLAIAKQQQNSLEQVRSLISSLPIYYRLSDATAADNAKQQALDLIATLPPESTTVYATINLAKLLQPEKVSFGSCYRPDVLPEAQNLLQQGVGIAQKLKDNRATSFALGELGHTYECAQDHQQALNLTKQARLAAEQHKDSLYLWEWQTGRILLAQDKSTEAITAYETAIATLESIRDDLLTANRDVQFDFRDTVEPIYRGLITRRLSNVDNFSLIQPTETPQTSNVNSILTAVDSLRLAELQNYFGNDCALADVVTTEQVNLLDPPDRTAYFSTITLSDRTAVIANFPGGKTKIVWDSNRGQAAIAQEINQFRRSLENFYTEFDVSQAQNIYSWLVQPFTEELEREQIKTLVFIQDGLLRSVPMAALYDGEQFLVQKYAIATTPSLNLIRPTTTASQELKALALGLSESSQVGDLSFPPLPNVATEIQQVQNIFTDSTGVLNQNFTRDRLRQELANESYPILHIATHGQFSSEPEDTFLVSGNNEKMTITELDRIIRTTASQNKAIDIIALTACQTAVGDERAALGLAGIADQAGVNSALASLWSISDRYTPEVVEDFYLGLRDRNLSKAAALQQAQIALIDEGIPPAFWSPFIIIGNWQ